MICICDFFEPFTRVSYAQCRVSSYD
jgi:hypothetical protein